MNRFYAMVAVCGLMAACVSTGIDVKPEQMQSFILGFSTLDDVTGQLGNPTSQATTSDGAIVLVYNTAAILAMLRHYREDRDFMYGLDIKFLDEARGKGG